MHAPYYSHYYREFYSPDIVWDSAQMILTLKLSSVAINYSDGIVPKEKKTPAMVKNELLEIPALLPYFGACRQCYCAKQYLATHSIDVLSRTKQ